MRGLCRSMPRQAFSATRTASASSFATSGILTSSIHLHATAFAYIDEKSSFRNTSRVMTSKAPTPMPLPCDASVRSNSTMRRILGIGSGYSLRTELRPTMFGSKPAPEISLPIRRMMSTSRSSKSSRGMSPIAWPTSSFSRAISVSAGTASMAAVSSYAFSRMAIPKPIDARFKRSAAASSRTSAKRSGGSSWMAEQPTWFPRPITSILQRPLCSAPEKSVWSFMRLMGTIRSAESAALSK